MNKDQIGKIKERGIIPAKPNRSVNLCGLHGVCQTRVQKAWIPDGQSDVYKEIIISVHTKIISPESGDNLLITITREDYTELLITTGPVLVSINVIIPYNKLTDRLKG